MMPSRVTGLIGTTLALFPLLGCPALAGAPPAPSAPAAATAAAAEPGEAEVWRRLAVTDGRGSGELALQLSRDWSVPQPDIVRAVITIHGEHRDARAYGRIASEALAAAGASGRGTLLVTPRFPAGGPPSLLRWPGAGWIDGQAASAPAALSSFEAMDALIDRLADRARFPSLRSIVLVGHSAGAQFVQRYAVLGRGEARAALAGIAMRHVIANPSSYAYFDDARPLPGGGFGALRSDGCPMENRWKYGLEALPPYAAGARPRALERPYVQRDVTYLLGRLDNDPTLRALDKSCAAQAQGADHLARGLGFFRYLAARHPGLLQRLHEVPGVGHDARGMLTSACALAAIYDMPACDTPSPDAAGR